MYITNQQDVAKIAEKSGVDWIFIDLEINGKEDRQGHLDTVISRHSIEDVKKINKVLTSAKLLVRVNPIYEGSKKEINRVINDGADIVMLPFFKNKEDVKKFIDYVDGRCKACLLLETPEASEDIDSILSVKGIDYIHIGLNDLHLGYNMKFMFELLADGTVEMLCNKIRQKGIEYGFGGIAQLGEGVLRAEKIITEHYRLSSSMVILSRSFCNVNKVSDLKEVEELFAKGIKDVRQFEAELNNKSEGFYKANQLEVIQKVLEIVGEKEKVVI
ncbi:aldolase/citrate lyase family protein [Senegalia sp. (in: firmicutes)]|uniref:aldolase/citrate lyase family protein n=1 Tax=Senegalia sp. (in: firmicutes) TaxID=1924098 RepID=UPI003F94F69C